MGTFKDLTDKRFGKLIAIERSFKKKGYWYWLCKCDCGENTNVITSSLLSNHTNQCIKCGLSNGFKDITGIKFHRLLVLKRVTGTGEARIKYLCLCDCGKETIILGQNLRNGTTKSCGCFNIEQIKNRVSIHITHNNANVGNATPEYRAWLSIKERCLNANSKSYKWYGGRGIKMFKEWVNDFIPFLNYIGKRPSKKHSVDRFPNNNGNYEPNNVRWATPKQQGENTRRVVNLTYDNITMNISDWARYFKVTPEAIRYHLLKGRLLPEIHKYYSNKRTQNKTTGRWNLLSQ